MDIIEVVFKSLEIELVIESPKWIAVWFPDPKTWLETCFNGPYWWKCKQIWICLPAKDSDLWGLICIGKAQNTLGKIILDITNECFWSLFTLISFYRYQESSHNVGNILKKWGKASWCKMTQKQWICKLMKDQFTNSMFMSSLPP